MSKILLITPILQRKKLRHKEIKLFVQSPTVRKWQIQDSKLLGLFLESLLLITTVNCLAPRQVSLYFPLMYSKCPE